jgi:hypothetical protein
MTPSDAGQLKKFGGVTFEDHRGDRPTSTTNTFTFTLNVSACAAANGATLTPGAPFQVNTWAFSLGITAGPLFTTSTVPFTLAP